jgi:hypothetical protein
MGRSVPSAARWRVMGRPAAEPAEPAEPPGPASSRNYCTAKRLSWTARASDKVRSRDKRRGGLAAPCVGVAFQKVGNVLMSVLCRAGTADVSRARPGMST